MYFLIFIKGKIVNFYEDTFKELGRDLLVSMYKVFVESYK
jgi:hypothetical protein